MRKFSLWTPRSVIFLSVLFGLVVVVVDGIIDAIFFEHTSFVDSLIFDVSSFEVYVRVSAFFSFVLFGVVISRIMGRLVKTGEALKEREARLSSLIDSAPIGIATADKSMSILTANREFCKILGYSENELTGMSYKDFTHPEDIGESIALVERLDAGEIPSFVQEKRYLKKGGEVIYGEVTVSALRGDDGKPDLYIAQLEDITERKRAEEALRESEAFSSSLLEFAPNPIVVSNVDTSIRYVNPALESLTGYSKTELIGRKIPYPWWPKENIPEYEIDTQVAVLPDLNVMNRFYQKKNGELFPVQLSIKNVVDQGITKYHVGNWVDMTEYMKMEDALRSSEERFRSMSQASFEGIVISEEGIILDANETQAAMLRCDLSDLIRRSVLDFIAPEFRDLAKQNVASSYEQPYELVCLRKDGSTFPAEARAKTAVYKGRSVRITAVSDLTERKKIENELLQSEEKYRSLVDHIKLGIFRSTPGSAGRFLEVNTAMDEITGYSRDELLEMDVSNLYVHPEERGSVIEEITERPGTRILTFKKKGGNVITVADTKTPVRDGSGKVIYFDGILEDITERRKAEEALRQSEENFRNLVENLPLGILITSPDGQTFLVNKTYLETRGYDSLDEVKRVPAELRYFDPKDREIFLELSKKQGKVEREVRLKRKDGSVFWAFSTSIPLLTASGEQRFLSVTHDITQRKMMEAQLIAQDRLVIIGQLVSGIAHELNNPLTGVIGFSALLTEREGTLPDDVREDLATINKEARRAADIVKGLLTFARQQRPEKEAVDVNRSIQETLQLRAYAQKVDNISVRTELANDLPALTANASQLQQVFLNIVINAEQAMSAAHGKGIITVTTERAGDYVKIYIADDGPGIAPENLLRLFTPFFTTKEVGKGTGLGLSICHGIITEHGGRIYAESEPGKGATFIIELPVKS